MIWLQRTERLLAGCRVAQCLCDLRVNIIGVGVARMHQACIYIAHGVCAGQQASRAAIVERVDSRFLRRHTYPGVAAADEFRVQHAPVWPGIEARAHVQPLHHHTAIEVSGVARPDHYNAGFVVRRIAGLNLPAAVSFEFVTIHVRVGRSGDEILAALVAEIRQREKGAHQYRLTGEGPFQRGTGYRHRGGVRGAGYAERRTHSVVAIAAADQQRAEETNQVVRSRCAAMRLPVERGHADAPCYLSIVYKHTSPRACRPRARAPNIRGMAGAGGSPAYPRRICYAVAFAVGGFDRRLFPLSLRAVTSITERNPLDA